MSAPLLLTILDGWGLREPAADNAIALANTPNYDRFLNEFPHSQLDASGHAVGLPEGIMGNSEVGHLNIGAGRVAQVGLTRIYGAINDKSFFSNQALLKAFHAAKLNNSTLHLIGLVSDGAVHSHQDHLFALLQMAKLEKVQSIAIHVFTDGRDTDPKSALAYMQVLEKKIQEIGVGKIATVSGRYYAMDRDQRWERTQQAYEAMVNGEKKVFESAKAGIKTSYSVNKTDEFIEPFVCVDENKKAIGKIQDQDTVIFFNFRADRARQITQALTEVKFDGFKRNQIPKLSVFVCMAEYDKKFGLPVAFPPVHLKNTLGEILSQQGLKQLRIAETEKYAHVTFFFNGGEETIFKGEERILIPSPREVATYDLKPEMSAPQLGDKVVQCIESQKYDVIILNFANADMVGHSGKISAAIKAVEVVDEQLGKIEQAILQQKGTMIITADHGNCEKMNDDKGNPHTAHTTKLVPFILIGENFKKAKLREAGTLADLAPTLLEILKIPQPLEMTGQSMLF